MRQILVRTAVLLITWAVGLLLAAWIVPRVSVSASGFIVALAVFTVAETLLSLLITKLPPDYASLLLGGTGLVMTFVALILASQLTDGLTVSGVPSWVATTVVVWLVTTIGAISLPDLFAREEAVDTVAV